MDTDDLGGSSDLGRRAARGVGWNAVGSSIAIILRFGSMIVVARFLSPAEFAVGGLALAAIGFFQILSSRAFSQALVRKRTLDGLTCDSVFWAGLGLSLAVGGTVASAAGTIAAFYDSDQLGHLMRILALVLVLNMLSAVPIALLQRAMRFRDLNVVSVSAVLASVAVAVALAVGGFGPYALVVPALASGAVESTLAAALSRYRPRLRISWDRLVGLSGFGLAQLGSDIIRYFNDNADYLVLSRVWPTAVFGQYYFAFERSRQPSYLLYGQMSSVLFPAFSRIQDDRERLRRAYLTGTRLFTVVIFPFYVLLIAFADEIVPFVFGEQWRPAVTLIRIFALVEFMRGFAVMVPSMWLALNRAHANLLFDLLRFVIVMPALVILAVHEAQPVVVAGTFSAIAIALMPIYIRSLHRLIGLDPLRVWQGLKNVVIGTVTMVGALLATRSLAIHVGIGVPGQLVLPAIVALGVFVAIARADLRRVWVRVREAAGR
jgi:O-antigen/teichoic acid export membrane protein